MNLVVLLPVILALKVVKADWLDTVKDGVLEADAKMKRIERAMASLGRQAMLQRFYADQRTRSDGDSGIKQQRIRRQGTKNYHSETHNGFSIAAIHDHPNQERTIGMGEVEVVLNGIQFRTKHNDYKLNMPDPESQEYHKTVPIEFPEVPDTVKELTEVKDQIAEMREYFRAFRDQDPTHRDYTKYFKSVLCYMEGTWLNTSRSDKFEEPFEHGYGKWRNTRARNWQDLFERNIFSEATGIQDRFGRMANLPYTILEFNGTEPVFAQWHYRILCHPTKELLPTKRLRTVDDFSSRLMTNVDTTKYNKQRQARFQINPEENADTEFNDKKTYSKPQFLDKLMEEIPGKNNYQGYLEDEGFETKALNSNNGMAKNAAFYHRWFRIGGDADAMGVNDMKRGYSDNFMFAAMTDHEQVVPMTINKCVNRRCADLTQRWTFAIPLEVVYLTPLNKWDPYNIGYKGDGINNPDAAVTGWGSCKDNEPDKTLSGANNIVFYRTPWEFYSGIFDSADVADHGARHLMCAYDQNNVRREVAASGTWIVLPEISDVGRIRTRYPIMPINGEGAAEWKELTALKDIMMDETKSHMRWVDVEKQEGMTLVTGPSTPKDGVTHSHKIYLSKHEVVQLKGGKYLTVKTTTDKFHSHEMFIRYRFPVFEYLKCDDERDCADGHSRYLGQEKIEE